MSTQRDNSNFSHRVYKNNPILFNSYIGKEVTVTTKNKSTHRGVVYTVDPVSESIVLLQLGKPTPCRLKIIFGHAIKNVDVTSEAKKMVPELFLPPPAKISQATVTKRKSVVMQLLLDNRFPVREEDNVLRIEDTVSIEPPYYPENCMCTNSIILGRVQGILTQTSE